MLWRRSHSVSIGLLQQRRHLTNFQKYENILVENPQDGVGLVTLNRPRTLNTLTRDLFADLNHALQSFEDAQDVRAIVLTGSKKAFSVGADLKEIAEMTVSKAYNSRYFDAWTSTISRMRTPLIAAANGHVLGGGCELALMCDIIYCSATASFSQPEVKLGIIPGAGGSQRLTRILGKSRAMDLVLTGRYFSGVDAERWGVAARCFADPESCLEGAMDAAAKISNYGQMATQAAKDVINHASEVDILSGLDYERRVFNGLFGTQDQKLGMQAFLHKNAPLWTNE